MPIRKPNQRGFSLLEVLIAVVVISIGFLATARMQVGGLRSSQNAYFTSQATFMMRDIADRMRANPIGVANGYYRNIETIEGFTLWPNCMNAQTECSPAEIAQADISSINRYLYPGPGEQDGFRPMLPSSDNIKARGAVDYDTGTNIHTISVSWSESIGGTDTKQTLSMQVFP